MENKKCEKLCDKSYKSADDKIKFLKHGMMFSYEQHWIVDNMPVTWCYDTEGRVLRKSRIFDSPNLIFVSRSNFMHL